MNLFHFNYQLSANGSGGRAFAACYSSLRVLLNSEMTRRLSFLLDSPAILNVVSCQPKPSLSNYSKVCVRHSPGWVMSAPRLFTEILYLPFLYYSSLKTGVGANSRATKHCRALQPKSSSWRHFVNALVVCAGNKAVTNL